MAGEMDVSADRELVIHLLICLSMSLRCLLLVFLALFFCFVGNRELETDSKNISFESHIYFVKFVKVFNARF